MGYILKNGISYSGNTFIPLTKAQYDALVTAGTVDPAAVYFITDRSGGSGAYASGVAYDNTDSQLDATNVQNAIDEVATVKSSIGNIDDVSITSPSTGDMLSWDGSAWANLAMATIIDKIYPVGSIYISVTDSTVAQVESRFGGTWQAFGSGRTLVGVDTSDTDFDTVEETGGAKSHSYTPAGSNAAVTLTAAQSGVPSHAHTYTRPTVSSSGAVTNGITGGSHSHTTKVRLMNGGSSTSTGYYGAPYQMYTGQVYDKAGGVTSFGDTTVLSVQNATHSHNLPNHSHTLTGGGVSNNTASDASQAHTNLQPYITTYMYKRIA